MHPPSLLLTLFGAVQLVAAANFTNSKTSPYLVSSLPDISYPLGDNYAGLLPISDATDETRKLFFWFWPTSNPDGANEITIWLQGGPGCSTLYGVLEENGPVVWHDGEAGAVQNPWALSRLTNVLYVDQPLGTGYSVGTPDIKSDKGLAHEFMGFYKNFKNLFDVRNLTTYLSGESYAGYFVSHIADAFIDAHKNTSDPDADCFDVAGVMLHSPLVGEITLSQSGMTMPYINKWKDVLLLNDTAMDALEKQDKSCGYDDYTNEWFQFPAVQKPMPASYGPDNNACNMAEGLYNYALDTNPCFNTYHIVSTCPVTMNAVPDPDGNNYGIGTINYFNRTDVKAALHVPTDISFTTCTSPPPYLNGNDLTLNNPPTSSGALARVIEYTNNTIIGAGEYDSALIINNTLLALQNMTWSGTRGFTQYPSEKFWVPKPAGLDMTLGASVTGTVGTWVTERGLTFFTVAGSGHEISMYVPAAAFRSFEVLLGKVKSLSSMAYYSINV